MCAAQVLSVGSSTTANEQQAHLLNISQNWAWTHLKFQLPLVVKVKQSRYRPGVAQRVPGS